MKLRGIRRRMRGWRLLRNVERLRFVKKTAKKQHLPHRGRRSLARWEPPFEVFAGDERFVRTVRENRFFLTVGSEKLFCPKNSLIITLPEVMNFDDQYDDSTRVISIFRRALEAGRRISYIDFSGLKEISPSCIMVFASYAYLWKRSMPAVHARCETWHEEVELAFSQLGVFDMLKMHHARQGAQQLRRVYMPLKTSGISNREGHDVGTETKKIRKEIEKFIGRPLTGVRMFGSVTEAIYNVRNHAYKDMKPGRLPFRWWLSVSYEEQLNELGIILFDHGYGIPKTMEESTKFSKFRKILKFKDGGWSEESRLFVAFERDRRKIGSARPFKEGRGHGCQDIVRLILPQDQNRVKAGSSLSVISGRARYDLSSNFADDRGDAKPLERKLQGTLIEWKIRL